VVVVHYPLVAGVRYLLVVGHFVEVCLEEMLCLWVVGVHCPWVVGHLEEVRLEEMLCPWVVEAHLEVVRYP
jgi:hypothetical protein